IVPGSSLDISFSPGEMSKSLYDALVSHQYCIQKLVQVQLYNYDFCHKSIDHRRFVVKDWHFSCGGAGGYGVPPSPLIYTGDSSAFREPTSAFRRWLAGVT
ncbi:hypothetical protein HAX54_039058, partial [Datura stramonium]|nr:hypothetical protein [Datura stramonium]